jgi:putative aldouronate transport system substrate-binding protein
MEGSMSPTVTRRRFLALASSAAAAAVLAACGGGASPTATSAPAATTAPKPTIAPSAAAAPATTAPSPAASTGGATAPAASAASGTNPTTAASTTTTTTANADGKLPSPAPGVPDAYTKFPTPFKTVNAIPGKNSKVTALLVAYNPPPPPRDQNKWWQEFEKRVGITYEPIIQPADGYPEKLAAITASGNLPDLTFLYFEQVPDQYKAIQQGAYTDLTSYLSGDGLKEFPNLALFPQYLWKNAATNGKLYGAPRSLLLTGAQMHWRKDWGEKLGIPQPKNADEFYDLMVKFTKNDPDGNGKQDSWGMHTIQQFAFGLSFFRNMFRVPNEWRKNADGTLTAYLETDEFKQTITYMKKLYDAGTFHPDTATGNRTQRKDYITTGKVGIVEDALTSWAGPNPNGYRDTARKLLNDPKVNITTLVPPGFDGGKATTDLTSGFTGYAAIPAKVGKDKERVKELLRVIDYFAAPFGSEEWVFMNYGLEGIHYKVMPDGTRVKTDQGIQEIGDLNNLCGPLTTYWWPTPGDAAEAQQAVKDVLALGIENPVLSLYSPTASAKGGELNQLRIDRVDALVTGRDPLSALDTFVKDWRSRGGDQIRKEYEQALKQ